MMPHSKPNSSPSFGLRTKKIGLSDLLFSQCQGRVFVSLILRRSRSLVSRTLLPSPSDLLARKACSWRHRDCLISTNNRECCTFTNLKNLRNVLREMPEILMLTVDRVIVTPSVRCNIGARFTFFYIANVFLFPR